MISSGMCPADHPCVWALHAGVRRGWSQGADDPGALSMLSRLYWYMVEFGLIATGKGLRVYGAGILSSKGETVYSIESPRPRRWKFDLVRVMRTEYRIDAFQQSYFVVDSFEELFEACYGTDFAPLYRQHAAQPAYPADAVLPGDRPVAPAS